MHGRKALESRLLLNFQWNFVAVFGIILPIVMASQTFGPFDHFDSVPGTLTTSSGQTVIDTEQVTAARSETSPGVQPEHMSTSSTADFGHWTGERIRGRHRPGRNTAYVDVQGASRKMDSIQVQ